jgi:hypothetical protein
MKRVLNISERASPWPWEISDNFIFFFFLNVFMGISETFSLSPCTPEVYMVIMPTIRV